MNDRTMFALSMFAVGVVLLSIAETAGSSIAFEIGPYERPCLSDEFRCEDGQCGRRCDGKRDCLDGMDEYGCPACSPEEFPCADGHCIPSILHCDGQPDCGDSSDEIDCSSRSVSTSGGGDIYTVANITKKSVKYGHNVDLVCDTNLNPPVNYSWMVHTHDQSLRKIVPNSKTLTVAYASANNSGIYVCKAVSRRATLRLPTVLTVELESVIPAFAGNGYITLPSTVKTADAERNIIEIHFKPKSDSGLIFYNQEYIPEGDQNEFISFGLNGGIPEFRYDVGTGAVLIRGNAPLTMHKWHRVILSRDGRDGFMEINGQSKFTGSSPGDGVLWQSKSRLFVGGYDNFAGARAELNTGFKGCIGRLRIDWKVVNLEKEAQSKENVQSCDNCDPNPCLNDGFCQETTSSLDHYYCICRPGYSGENCQLRKDTCYAGCCGSGQCLENEEGIECLCPFGTTGKRCGKRIDIDVPAFTKNSYVAYSTPIVKKQFKLLLKLKPAGQAEVDNGIVLYAAESDGGDGVFIALSIVNSTVELRCQVGGSSISVTNSHYLVPNEYVTVSVTMDSSELVLGVADTTTLMSIPSRYISNFQLLRTPLYVGGFDKKSISLPKEMSVRNGFHGCISKIEILGMNFDIMRSYVEAINVNDCFSSFGDICKIKLPCTNGGTCVTSRNTYRCDCPRDFGGTNCERRKDMCEILNPCENNGTCVGDTSSFKCYCGLGSSGVHCEINTTLEDSVSLGGDGYVELHYDALDAVVNVSFATRNSSGLLYWHGQQTSFSASKYDFISIAIENGFVRLAYQAYSSGVRIIDVTDNQVDDGETHSITVRRVKTRISIELDSKTSNYGEIPEMWTTHGSIYIGGLPDVRFMTGGLYANNFNGCVKQLSINDSVIDFGKMAISARNAATCPL